MNALNTFKTLLICSAFLILFTACADPESRKQAYVDKGIEYLHAHDIDKARIEFKNALQIDPKFALAYNYLGEVEEANQNWPRALFGYDKALELDPALVPAHINLGYFMLRQSAWYYENGDAETGLAFIEKAEQHVAEASKKDNSSVIQTLKAHIIASRGNTADAIALLEHILAQDTGNTKAILLAMRLNKKIKNYANSEQILVDAIKANPTYLEYRTELAQLYADLNEYGKAINTLKEATRNSGNFGLYVSLAGYQVKSGNIDQAEATYRTAIDNDPEDMARYMAYAEFLQKYKTLDEAITQLTAYSGQHDDLADLQLLLASLHEKKLEIGKATTILEDVIRKYGDEPSAIRARRRLANIFITRNNLDKAMPLLEYVLKNNREDNDALMLQARIFNARGDTLAAANNYRTVLKNQPDSIETIQLLADTHVRAGQFEIAEDLLKRGPQVAPDNINAYLNLARFYMAKKNYALANEYFDTAFKKFPDDLGALALQTDMLALQGKSNDMLASINKMKILANNKPDGWFRMARVYKSQGKLPEARAELITALEKDPQSVDLLAELTDLEITLKMQDSAIKRLQDILQRTPAHVVANKFLGMVYLSSNDLKNGELALLAHLKAVPDDAAVLDTLGWVNLRSGNTSQALTHLKKAVELQPDVAVFNQHLGMAYKNSGDSVTAKKYLDKSSGNQTH
jgi:tetratricopeptide (TPR) repeat protein